MTLPTIDTTVLYPDGSLSSSGVVLHREDLPDGRAAIILDSTAFHPVDAAWPDQPADRGTMSRSIEPYSRVEILDAIVAATDGDSLFIGSDAPVKKGTPEWAFVVAHLVDGAAPFAEGDAVTVSVDAEYRRSLSAGHTACHLASLALNQALAGAWRKDVATDAAGSPNFDALAIDSSTIVPDGSVDVYRIGKSLRKRGFDPESLADPGAVAERANGSLSAWIATGAHASVERPNSLLTGRREWVCDLPDGRISIPCGGTHIGPLDAFEVVSVELAAEQIDGATIVTMRTESTPRR
ncbi:alanyl-tRNA synthetase [Labedella gwakjiensis]|uniref:Alanyl-tRNA synthetase n=1 Tax=Labedella gwakjiensis TaxID=390269 RepID=A0A2P8GVR1_9MICO|nr:metal-dependent hydrolase [Labedella gwakjiensis]PSL38054.1 alanyl-tRNA synthetase [Labedella gwakjiensis]RUQ87387.1 metal-dependent hydrolase [Labedella gwakjiensis]